MNNCEGCIYEQDKMKIMTEGLLWASSQPHPCMNCKRLPVVENKPDNYRKGNLK